MQASLEINISDLKMMVECGLDFVILKFSVLLSELLLIGLAFLDKFLPLQLHQLWKIWKYKNLGPFPLSF